MVFLKQPCAKEFLEQLMLTVWSQVQAPCFYLKKKLGWWITLQYSVGYGYTRWELCGLATEYAVDLDLRSRDNPLSLQWYISFIQRWPNLAVKKPRTLSIARAKATAEDAVNSYFSELDKILTKYSLKDKSQYIYNIDEKGISDNRYPLKIVTDKSLTPMAVTSGMSSTVTVLGAGNTLETCIPPFFCFPRQPYEEWIAGGSYCWGEWHCKWE